MTEKTISVRFHHGLGDCSNFARMIPLYVRRGYRVEIECTADKEIIFCAAGAEIVANGAAVHEWSYPPTDVPAAHGSRGDGSKLTWNLSAPPLPDIGPKSELWDEYCQADVRPTRLVPATESEFIDGWLSRLPRPIILLHTKGNTGQQRKSLPERMTKDLYQRLLDRFEGTLILLDWDRRVPRLAHGRVRHLDDLPGGCPTPRLFALIEQADLLVGVDSGPLHAAGLTDTPSVGLWMPGHYPARYAMPDRNRLNIVLSDRTGRLNRYHRIPWRIVEHPGAEFEAARVADWIAAMLGPSHYLPTAELPADIQLRQWIGDWCRGIDGNSLSYFADRNHSFRIAFSELSRRQSEPQIVETGCIRSEEDWPGAGFFSYLAGHYASCKCGRLDSVDLDPGHCAFAREWCAVFGDSVRIVENNSIAYLEERTEPIDLLYCDSLDTYESGHADHALAEVQAAMPHLHLQSLIMFDDSPWNAGSITGKAATAVPWLLQNGWQVLYSGYQILLKRADDSRSETFR